VDKVCIQGLTVETVIGVYDWERIEARELLIDVVLATDLQKASETDDVLDTIDYALVAECIQTIAKASEFQLLESLAGAIFKALFARFRASEVDLTIHKPDILPDAKGVSINMIRQRP
jgi:dihydroneopterin aldolase